MRATGAIITVLLGLHAGAWPAQADMGPCRPDNFHGLICGSGVGAARVIDNTRSPDQTFAFAWRNPKGEPTDEPDGDDKLDLLLVRLADGAVLARSATEHWATGERRANRRDEYAAWSPDGRFVLRIAERRFDTGVLDLFAIAADGTRAASVDLKKIVEPALRARLKSENQDPGIRSFDVAVPKQFAVGDDGLVQIAVTMWVPKEGPSDSYDVVLRVARGKGSLDARIASIQKGKARRAD